MYLYYKEYKHLDYPINVLYEATHQKHVKTETIDPSKFYDKEKELNAIFDRIMTLGILTEPQICVITQFYKEKYFMRQIAEILNRSETYLVKEKRKALDMIYIKYGHDILKIVKG